MKKYQIDIKYESSYGELVGGDLVAEGSTLAELISNATVGFEYGGGEGIKHVNIGELRNFAELEEMIINEYIKLKRNVV
jgi:hypothetical protein